MARNFIMRWLLVKNTIADGLLRERYLQNRPNRPKQTWVHLIVRLRFDRKRPNRRSQCAAYHAVQKWS